MQTFASWRNASEALSARRGVARPHAGFTLVELMVTLAVAVIMLLIAIPNFRTFMLSNRLDTAANDFVAALNTARMEAVKANAASQFCGSSAALNTASALGTACGSETGAVVLTTGASVTKVLVGPTSVSGGIQLDGDVQAIQFGGDGLGRVVGASTPAQVTTLVDLCTNSLSSKNHRVVSITSGSVIAVATDTRSCP